MTKIFILTLSAISLLAFTSIEKGTIGDAPGLIQCIGDAGSPNIITFRKWAITESEIPNNDPEKIVLKATINTSSLTCDFKDLAKNIRKKKDYFYVKKFPNAYISVNGAQSLGDGQYRAEALLTLKKFTKPVELTFTMSDTKPYKIKGSGTINRRKFGFTGGGPKDEVPVNFEFVLP